MSDLISRSAVIDIIHKEIERTSTFSEHETQINIEMAVSELPTAYNLDAVVEELEKQWNNAICIDDDMFYLGIANGLADAIDIVKSGGVK